MDKIDLAKDLLDNIVQRLEKIEKRQEDQIKIHSQTEQILERLDTIHNRLERQNQKQNSLDDKLSDVSHQLEQEKVFMRNQLQDAQNKILCQLTDLQVKGEQLTQLHGDCGRGVELSKKNDDSGTGKEEHVPETLSDDVNRTMAEFEGLKIFLKDSLNENRKLLGTEISKSAEIVKNELQQFRTQAGEERKGLPEQITRSIADFTRKTEAQFFQQSADIHDRFDNINASNEDFRSKMSSFQRRLSASEETLQQYVSNGVTSVLEGLRGSPVTYIKPVFSKETLVLLFLFSGLCLAVWYKGEGLASVKSDLIQHFDYTKREIVSVTENTKSEIISVIHKTKRDILSFTEKENQLVRDRIAGYLPSRKMYTFDFYVENFKQLVKSGRVVISLPWHINQFGTSVSGYVHFQNNGEMSVMLIHGRNPREVGLEPKVYGTLKFKATITDTSGGLPGHVVGEETWTKNEENIKDNKYWGRNAGVVSCDELIKEGYGEKEDYKYGALLIRYEITVL